MTMTRTKRVAGARWLKLRRRILMAEPLCRLCADGGRLSEATEIDHYPVPLHRGGAEFDPGNVRPLCRDCHLDVTRQQRGLRPKARISIDGWPE